MPQSYSGDVGSTEDPTTAFPSTVVMGRQVAAPRSSSVDQRSPSTEPSATSSYSTVGTVVRYLECQRNHAAAIGGYAVDGCREFMASGDAGETALACAACGCHRSFHRRELELVPPS